MNDINLYKNELMIKHSFEIDTKELHYHDHFEIMLVIDGSATYHYKGQDYNLNRGTILVIHPFSLHRLTIVESNCFERIIIRFNLDLINKAEDIIESINKTQLLVISNNEKYEEIKALFISIYNEKLNMLIGYEILLESLVTQLLIKIARIKNTNQECIGYKKDKTIIKCIEYIDNNFDEDITLDILSEILMIDKYTLSHKFSSQLDISIYQCIIKKRLMEARKLFNTTLSFTEIAHKCGFVSYTNFYKCFIKQYGIKPSMYR